MQYGGLFEFSLLVTAYPTVNCHGDPLPVLLHHFEFNPVDRSSGFELWEVGRELFSTRGGEKFSAPFAYNSSRL
jgi:hypothetical protein